MLRITKYNDEYKKSIKAIRVQEHQTGFVASIDKVLDMHHDEKHDTRLFVLLSQGEVIGLCLYRINVDFKNIFIWQIMIDQHHQGKGYGKKFLELIEGYIKDNELFKEIVTTYKNGNLASKALFENSGYVEFSVEEDEVNLKKTLLTITRIDTYDDDRFTQEVLNQHGAYIVNGIPCSFLLKNRDEAVVDYVDYSQINEVIELFRFYTGHVVKFYDVKGNLLKEYEPVNFNRRAITELQPSQFYVSEAKLAALSSWANQEEDFVVPVMRGKNIIMDGHTRLYLAQSLGLEYVYVYEEASAGEEDLMYFVEEAKRRSIIDVRSLEKVSHEDYIKYWYSFCDDYFGNKSN